MIKPFSLLISILIFIVANNNTALLTSPQKERNGFIKLASLSPDFAYDMRYATTNNFLKKKVYKCADCIIRKNVGQALVEANDYFISKGYRIQFYDCYRPLDVQKAMWKIFPKPGYVANPATGSIHNRGGAVDITLMLLADSSIVDMGTDFDHFGKEAHHNYDQLSSKILENRRLLKTGMEKHGFSPIRTEWWHYNFNDARKYPVSNFKVECTP